MNDLIFRSAAIEVCNQQTMDCNPDHFNGHEHFTEFLDDATIGSFGKWQFANGFNVGVMAARIAIKNIDPAQQWIPVTEKLPAAFHQVLCYGHNGIMIDYFSGETTEIYGKPLFMISEAKITHWMPLPEPPKEEGK